MPSGKKKNGRDEEPSALIIDSQSVESDSIAEGTGDDTGKKIKGIKRHVVVDVLGLLFGVVVHAASIQDRDGARILLECIAKLLPKVKIIWADSGYAGELIKWVKMRNGWKLEIVKRTRKHVFSVLPKRWIVERTFDWLMF